MTRSMTLGLSTGPARYATHSFRPWPHSRRTVKVSRRRPSPNFSDTSAALDRRLAENERGACLHAGVLERLLVCQLVRADKQRHDVAVGRDAEGVLGAVQQGFDLLVRVEV